MKTISVLLIALLLAGCSATYQPRPDVALEQTEADKKECKQGGMRTTGWVLVAIGAVTVPIGFVLMIPGAVVLGEAVKKEKECMALRGYQTVEQPAG